MNVNNPKDYWDYENLAIEWGCVRACACLPPTAAQQRPCRCTVSLLAARAAADSHPLPPAPCHPNTTSLRPPPYDPLKPP